jgi:sugar phosphate isomerase/epimerase
MKRPYLTLFTGQWADMPLAKLAPLARRMGYDGLELACWGDHFDVRAAVGDSAYLGHVWSVLQANGLGCRALSNHLVGQAVCDRIDERHKSILPSRIWGDGEPEGVRRRAAEEMILTARAARLFFDAAPAGQRREGGPRIVNGFTGSPIWHLLYGFPPVPGSSIEEGYAEFSRRWLPILDAFEREDVYFALEVHPTEIAFDGASAERAIEAVKGHPRFGFNYDPSHLAYQGVDYVRFLRQQRGRIFHVHVKDVWWGHGDGSVGVFGGHTAFGDPRRYWDFRSPGRGDILFEDIFVALSDIGYEGPLSVEWEDSRMDRVHGATEAASFVRRLIFPPADGAFDSAFERRQE